MQRHTFVGQLIVVQCPDYQQNLVNVSFLAVLCNGHPFVTFVFIDTMMTASCSGFAWKERRDKRQKVRLSEVPQSIAMVALSAEQPYTNWFLLPASLHVLRGNQRLNIIFLVFMIVWDVETQSCHEILVPTFRHTIRLWVVHTCCTMFHRYAEI